jgi:hypothetical protein
MATSVFCTATPAQTEIIVQNLRAAGFSGNDISVLLAESGTTRDFAIENQTKAPEGASVGLGTGLAVGGTLGWLTGIGALAIPGLGPFIAAGPIMAALGGAAVGGAVGSLTGALIGMGIPEYKAKQYEGKVKAGSSLISVHSDDSELRDRAQEIFEDAGAEDISSAGLQSVPREEREPARRYR